MEDLLDSMFTEVNGVYEPSIDVKLDSLIRSIILRDSYNIDGHYPREKARRELTYVYFMANKKILSGFTKDEKSGRMKKKAGLHESWEPDTLILQAIKEVTEDTVTLQDKLLDSTRGLAEDFLGIITEMRSNSKRLIDFFSRPIDTLTQDELEKRTVEIKNAKDDVVKFAEMVKSVDTIIMRMDELVAKRNIEDKKKARKKLSSLETVQDRYTRKQDVADV